MSEIDRAFAEREARRHEQDRQRRERVDIAVGFLREFFERDVATSQTLQQRGIAARMTDNALVLHNSAAGIHGDPFIVAVGPDGEIDCAGRSLGRYTGDGKVEMKRALVAEILNVFDL